MSDMIGKLVRWERRGQWFTARVTGYDGGSGRGSLTGEVVDPGNYIGLSEFVPKQVLKVGDELPNLRPNLLTVIDDGDWCNCQAIQGTAIYPGPWHPKGGSVGCVRFGSASVLRGEGQADG